jgi:hypothetical protein
MMPKHAAPIETLPRPNTPFVAAGTTGADLVHMADEVVWLESYPADTGGPDYAGRRHEQLLEGLNEFRGQLGSLTEAEKDTLAPYVQSLDSQDVTGQTSKAADARLIDELIASDNGHLIEFTRRHVATVELQTHDMQPFIQGQKEVFVMGIRYEVAEGRMSPYALKVIDTVPLAEVRVSDWWATRLKGGHGAYNYAQDVVKVAQGIGVTTQERDDDFREHSKKTIPHELYHREFNTAIAEKDDWLHEAMAEHIALSLLDGEMDVLHPDDRTGDRGVYYDYRALAAEMMNGIDTTLLTRAATSDGLRSREWRELNTKLQEKYGIDNVPAAITERVAQYTELLRENDQSATDNYTVADAAHGVAKELATKPWVVTGLQMPHAQQLGAHVMSMVRR